MKLLLCVAVFLYVVIKAECRQPVVIRRIPTLADFNLTKVPRHFEDRGAYNIVPERRKFQKEHYVRVKVKHYCTYPGSLYRDVRYPNKTEVNFYEKSSFFDEHLKTGWMDENGNIDIMISGFDNIIHPQIEVYYTIRRIPCPTCDRTRQYTSPASTEEYSFLNEQDAYNNPWTHEKTVLSRFNCEPPKMHGYGSLQNQKYQPGVCTPLNCMCFCPGKKKD